MCCNAPKEGIVGECGYGCKPGWSRLQLGGALQREHEVTTAALKALRCSASGDGVDFVITIDLTEQQLGRCPKPHQRRCLWTPQGEKEKRRSLPLDPLCAIELFSLPLLLPRVALLGGIPIPYHFMNQVEIYPVLPSTSTLHQSVPCSSTFTSVPTGTRASTSAFSDAPFRKFT